MRIQAILPSAVKRDLNNTKMLIKTNADTIGQSISDNIQFGVGEEYAGIDFDAPENPNTSNPGFVDGLKGIATMLTFPVSVPALIAYEAYKDKHKDEIKTNMNLDNIEE